MGGYLARKPIPADRERFGVDDELTMRNDTTLHQILAELANARASYPQGSAEQKLGDFFASGMDTQAIEAAGLKPIKKDLDAIESIKTKADLNVIVNKRHAEGSGVYFSFYGTTDATDASETIGEFSQGGLTLPEPEYYTKDENKELLEQYEAHVAKMFELSGLSPQRSATDAASVVALETKLAQISLSSAELRDPESLVNKKSLAQLNELSQAFPWKDYLSGQGVPAQDTYNVATPNFFTKLGQVLKDTPLEDHKAYLRWHLLNDNATELPAAFDREHFNFFGKAMRGLQKPKSRLDRITHMTDSVLGDALGTKFVERRFSAQAKEMMTGMVNAFKDALRERLATVSWMSTESRQGALAKIDCLGAKIGSPDKPQDYADFEVGNSYIDNVRASSRYGRERNLSRIGKPVDKSEWEMTAATNNAYYQPTNNEICFPAGILQPPYFDRSADPAINFGGIGATIGHELGHGFDDEGAQFDAGGNLNQWMTDADLAKFKQKAEGVEKQFNEFMIEGLPVNGKQVLGEAMADLSGLELAYAAFKIATKDQPAKVIDGFTPDQRFFLAYAQSWATNLRPEYAKLMVKSDPHPHPLLRVNATLSNMKPFFTAFGVQSGQPMRRPEPKRNEIWA